MRYDLELCTDHAFAYMKTKTQRTSHKTTTTISNNADKMTIEYDRVKK